ncbi:unnamed protein product, partial [Pleuronectes platessa]
MDSELPIWRFLVVKGAEKRLSPGCVASLQHQCLPSEEREQQQQWEAVGGYQKTTPRCYVIFDMNCHNLTAPPFTSSPGIGGRCHWTLALLGNMLQATSEDDMRDNNQVPS